MVGICRGFTATLAATALASVLMAQTAEQPKAVKAKDKGSAAQTDYVLRMEVRRVPLDIVVTDKDGNPVRGLKRDDFIIKEDKKTQKALTFEYFDGSTPSYVPRAAATLPANTYVNQPSSPERGPLYILYYDMVNTTPDDQMSVHKQMLDFLDHASPGARIALFVNASGLHMIQGFTSDHPLLRSAILQKGPGPHVPDVFIFGQNYGYEDAGAALSNLKFMAEYMNGIPGRKNLLWLSSEFPIPVGPTISGRNTNTGVGGGFSSSTYQINDLTYLMSDLIKRSYSAMMKSEVALYPVNLHGVAAGGDSVAEFEHEDDIAQATGGQAYYANNRLKELLDKSMDNGASYYSLSYSPTNTKYDGQNRNIEVSLAKKTTGYTLTYRKLYYGLSDQDELSDHKPNTPQARNLAAKAADNLYANIEHGAPMLHDLMFSAHLVLDGAPELATAEQMNQLEDSPIYFRTRKHDKTPKPLKPVELQKYKIAYGVFDPQLKALSGRKEKPATLEFAAAAYDNDGRLLNSMLNVGLASGDDKADGKQGELFHGEQELEVPPGAAWVRLAVRDTATNRTGTLEVKLPLKPEMAAAIPSKGD